MGWSPATFSNQLGGGAGSQREGAYDGDAEGGVKSRHAPFYGSRWEQKGGGRPTRLKQIVSCGRKGVRLQSYTGSNYCG